MGWLRRHTSTHAEQYAAFLKSIGKLPSQNTCAKNDEAFVMRPREEWPKAAQRKAPVTKKEAPMKHQQSAREKALQDNPWAMALAQPNRKDLFSQANIPRDFCIQFHAVSHPVTGKQWAAPRMLLDADDDRQVQQASTSSILSYITANRSVIEAVFKP